MGWNCLQREKKVHVALQDFFILSSNMMDSDDIHHANFIFIFVSLLQEKPLSGFVNQRIYQVSPNLENAT